jgi:hypothetical protein
MKSVTACLQRLEGVEELQQEVHKRQHRRVQVAPVSKRGAKAAPTAFDEAPAPTPSVTELFQQPALPVRTAAQQQARPQTEGYSRLFSLWHSLHIPLIFVMVIAAVIHVRPTRISVVAPVMARSAWPSWRLACVPCLPQSSAGPRSACRPRPSPSMFT